MLHERPLQQSACEVHVPVAFTHVAWHTLLTHGLPQQSALVAQLAPGWGGSVAQSFLLRRQRGMPRASLRQQLSGLPLQ
jgi:hypothetical protein